MKLDLGAKPLALGQMRHACFDLEGGTSSERIGGYVLTSPGSVEPGCASPGVAGGSHSCSLAKTNHLMNRIGCFQRFRSVKVEQSCFALGLSTVQ